LSSKHEINGTPDNSPIEIISNNNFSGANPLFFNNRKKSDFYEFFVYFQQEKKMKKVLLSGFEPESKPRKGLMIGRYTTGAKFYLSSPKRIHASIADSKSQK
jgi:hypothetical protein